MSDFKEGDVIIYGEGIWDPPSNGIVDRVESGRVFLQAFQHFTGNYNGKWCWTIAPVGVDRCPRPHPDPDPVWADFCKWRLTNASASD